jgi:hypothetical protein
MISNQPEWRRKTSSRTNKHRPDNPLYRVRYMIAKNKDIVTTHPKPEGLARGGLRNSMQRARMDWDAQYVRPALRAAARAIGGRFGTLMGYRGLMGSDVYQMHTTRDGVCTDLCSMHVLLHKRNFETLPVTTAVYQEELEIRFMAFTNMLRAEHLFNRMFPAHSQCCRMYGLVQGNAATRHETPAVFAVPDSFVATPNVGIVAYTVYPILLGRALQRIEEGLTPEQTRSLLTILCQVWGKGVYFHNLSPRTVMLTIDGVFVFTQTHHTTVELLPRRNPPPTDDPTVESTREWLERLNHADLAGFRKLFPDEGVNC